MPPFIVQNARSNTTSIPIPAKMLQRFITGLNSVHPEMVDFGSGQGRRELETGGVAEATARIFNDRERRTGPQDAIHGWTLVKAEVNQSVLENCLAGVRPELAVFGSGDIQFTGVMPLVGSHQDVGGYSRTGHR